MKTLRFNSIKLRNFMSFGNDPVELSFQNGLNLITGFNKDNPDLKNGIGKSTICDALVFCLYDETIKNLKKTEIVNDKNKKNCEVELSFSIDKDGVISDYIIKRGISPSYCNFYINDVDSTKSGIPQTNSAIEKCIGISKSLFQQSIIMSVGNSVSFFGLKSQDKRAFIEGVFDLDVFSKMLSEARNGFNDSKKTKDSLTIQLQSENVNLKHLIEKNDGFEENKRLFIEQLQSQNIESESKILELEKSIQTVSDQSEIESEISELKKKLSALDDAILNANVKVQSIDNNIKTTSKEIKLLESIGDICSKCNRPLDAEEITGRLNEISQKRTSISEDQNKITVANDKLLQAKKLKADLETKIKSLNDKMNTNKMVIEKNKLIKSHILTLKRNMSDNLNKISEKTEETSAFKELISTSELKIANLTSELSNAKLENSVFESCKFILSEEGVKSVIIKELKNFLNAKLNNYLIELEAPIQCTFDEYFEETLTNAANVEKSYFALSGGERRRLDMAVLFTLQDMLRLRSGIDVQLSFYDEILDTAIDESGRKRILQILKDKSNSSSIYVISHRPKMSDLIDNEIVLVKHDDFTTIQSAN
jgi:DNA repair exonuclease SbcCD ATPase subunit